MLRLSVDNINFIKVFTRVGAGLLAVYLVFLVSTSVFRATWGPAASQLSAVILLGLVYGAGLAWSRFRRAFMAVCSLLMSIGLGILIVGQTLLPFEQIVMLTPGETFWIMHRRLLAFSERISRELSPLVIGHFKDKDWFAFLMVVLLWNAGVWLAWCLLRRRQALTGILPCAILLIVNQGLSGQVIDLPVLFILGVVVLMVRTALTERRHDWERRGIDYPELIADQFIGPGILITLAIGAAAWASRPDTWQNLNDWLTVRLEELTGSADEDNSGPPQKDYDVAPNLQSPDMSQVGSFPPTSQAIVMWVRTSDPPPVMGPDGRLLGAAPSQHYWRSEIYARYTGSGWEPAVLPPTSAVSSLIVTAPDVGHYILRQEFQIVAEHDRHLYGVNLPVTVSTLPVAGRKVDWRDHIWFVPAPITETVGVTLTFSAGEDSSRLDGNAYRYNVTSWATRVTAPQLRADTTDYPPDIAADYLQLPDSLPQRVRDLAARLVAGQQTPYEKAVAIQNHLRTAYFYRLDVPTPPGQDVVDYFLFEAPGGSCGHYASAMAVMLRTQGVPVRVVTGYATGEYNAARQAYQVPASAAHAWVEVYFPKYGWVEFEPTSSRTAWLYAEDASVVIEPTPAVEPLNLRFALPPVEVIAPWVALPVGLIIIGLLVVAGIRRRGRWAKTPAGQARRLYWEARWALANVGCSAPANVTPNEFLSACAVGQLAHYADLQAALQQLTQLYVSATFSSVLPGPADVRQARRTWQRAWREYSSLWMRAVFQRRPARAQRHA